MGASVFPQQHGYNPTGTLGALAYWSAKAITEQYLKKPGTAGAGVTRMNGGDMSMRIVALVPRRPCCRWPRSRRRPRAADAEHGKELFTACAACHTEQPDALGPSLKGVVGRKSAALEDFRYSKPMKRANLVWDEANLRQFLGPAGQGEGQPHAVRRPERSKDVDDVVAYLETLK